MSHRIASALLVRLLRRFPFRPPARGRDLLVVASLVATARFLAPRMGIGGLLRIADDIGNRLPVERRTMRVATAATDRTIVLTERVRRRIPGSTCLHRSFAACLFLAALGVEARIVVGIRHRNGLEGHAWVEVDATDGSLSLFAQEGYRPILIVERPAGDRRDGDGESGDEHPPETIDRESRSESH